ncbi:ABC transporter permease [Panacibacter sp. DH6]|uniref:ABC transporter permease n=1 Tax=Panacibacter microcysteis TaxID=2793269 RepID=A0A931GY74_9BACT|nr:ABC transporter permease [Panacibacter microcysteis]MBG9377564.1 ABC transporter permease [Panacibacter microcysteis]
MRHKLFSFINIFGLSLSLLVCLLIMSQVLEDLSYDTFSPYAHNTYRVLTNITELKNKKQYQLASSPLPLKGELQRNEQVVQYATQLYPALKGNATFEGKKLPVNAAFTDASFFKVFGFGLLSGNEDDALAVTNGIVISKATAQKFFGNANPVGKTLDFGKMGLYQVTGVLKDNPGKSHLDFDAYASILATEQLRKSNVLPALSASWNTLNDGYTYAVVKPGISSAAFQGLLSRIQQRPELRSAEGSISFTAQPLLDIVPGSDNIYNEISRGNVWAKVLTVIGVGLIILLAACFNYTNLTIARALTRAKEVGVRKVSGATRMQVFMQYIVESMVIAFAALFFACCFIPILQPGFHFTVQLMLFAGVFTFITALAAGSFPSWILSAFKPVQVLKNVSVQKLFGNISLQKALMIFQFSLSILVVMFLSVYYRQFSYLGTIDTGFTAANIITIPASANDKIFVNEIAKISGVKMFNRQSDDFGIRGSGSLQLFLDKPVNGQGIAADYYFADAGTVPLHGLKLVAGSNFDNDNAAAESAVLINRKAVAVLGFKDAAAAINKTVWLNDSTQVAIIGVLADFYDKGAARNINPLVLRNNEAGYNYINILVNAAGKDKTLQEVSRVWKTVNPHAPFEYEWLDQKIAARENQSGTYTQMGFLAFVTISIAALGLLGLVIYTVETKQKEISIRKVIGASVNQLMFLLSKGFVKLIVIAGLIATPVGLILSVLFLQNFPNRVSIGAGTVLVGFIFLLLIGLVTILSNTYRASSANPVKNLRVE